MKAMLKVALADFQKFYGLAPTGKMDEATSKAMQQPRCGEKDILSHKELHSRRKRYTHWGEPWTGRELTYAIPHYPQNTVLSQAAVEEEIALAFAVWASVSDLVFRQVSRKADINISFFKGQHGDGKPFDGRGMILGHASKPMGGIVHFDDDEPWSIRRFSGRNLFLVAVHDAEDMLHNDITGLQLLYGKRKRHPPDLCSESSFDAIFENPDGIIYVLKGQYYWKLSQDGFVNSYPLLISHHWQGLPGDVDAAFATSSGKTYFFKGNKYWAYRYTHPLAGHPKLISEGWPGIPDDVDAATWYTDSVFLFCKG